MTYKEALHELYHQLPVFQKSGALAYKPGFERTLALLEANGNPHLKLDFVHIAGTNGKGSVSHMSCSILMESGYSCGLFTSPHLVDFRERIKLNGHMIDKNFVCRFTEKNKSLFDTLKPSFFEVTTTLALCWFVHKKADIVVLETGMGGRLDSTNVVTPLVSVITNIGIDHAQFLGKTLEKIAGEKAGIIKERIPVVVGEVSPSVKKVIRTKATSCNTRVIYAQDKPVRKYASTLAATYQQKNIQTVRQIFGVLVNWGLKITIADFKRGLKNVIKNTGIRGRYETLSKNPRIVCDAAHNLPGMKALAAQLKTEKYKHLHIVIGFANDKDVATILKELPKSATYYFTHAKSERSMPAEELSTIAYAVQRKGEIFTSVKSGLRAAKKSAGKKDLIIVTGSFFVLAEAIQNSK